MSNANKNTTQLPGSVGVGDGGGIIRLDDVTNTQGRTIPNATAKNSGVMTKTQAAQLAALVAGGGGGGGALAFNVTQAAGDMTAAFRDLVDGDPTGGSFTVSLPRADSVLLGGSNIIAVKNSSTSENHVTVFPHDTDTIDGGGSVALQTEDYLFLVSDGVSNWIVVAAVSNNGPTAALVANAAIDQFALIKASAVVGRFETLQVADSPLLMVGVATTAAGGAGAKFSAQLIPGTETIMLSDGTGVINAGDTVTPSTTVAGRVKAGASNVVGSALSDALAVLNAQVTVL